MQRYDTFEVAGCDKSHQHSVICIIPFSQNIELLPGTVANHQFFYVKIHTPTCFDQNQSIHLHSIQRQYCIDQRLYFFCRKNVGKTTTST